MLRCAHAADPTPVARAASRRPGRHEVGVGQPAIAIALIPAVTLTGGGFPDPVAELWQLTEAVPDGPVA